MRREQEAWEELAEFDPLWAVLSEPNRKGGRWELDAFLATGEEEVARTLGRIGELGLPERRDRALDFGCGVGRTSRALASRFVEVIGLDASQTMVRHARRINRDVPNASFRVGSLDDFDSGAFDLVWSVLVLQHLAPDEVEDAIAALVDLVRPGGVGVLQLPYATRQVHRLQLARRVYRFLRGTLRLRAELILRSTPLTPMRMTTVGEERVRALVRSSGGHIIRAEPYAAQTPATPSRLYVVTRPTSSR